MEQRVMDNVFLEIAIRDYLSKENQTKESFLAFCKRKDACIGMITKIKVGPYYFNEKGKKLCYLFIDIDTGIGRYISKNGKKVNLNIKENRIEWNFPDLVGTFMNEIPATEDAKDTEDAKEYINTGTSLFVAIPFNEGDLLANCVAYVSDKLLINPPAVIFGKSVNMRRSIGFFSNESVGYAYSGQVAVAQSLNEDLLSLLDLVNKKLNSDFNAILVNKYPDGNHYIGKHSDDERALSNKGVACLSYGACRKFRIRNKSTGKIVLDVPTNSNELWCMSGDFQKEFTHEVPVEKKVKEERISFTFRKHLNLSK